MCIGLWHITHLCTLPTGSPQLAHGQSAVPQSALHHMPLMKKAATAHQDHGSCDPEKGTCLQWHYMCSQARFVLDPTVSHAAVHMQQGHVAEVTVQT